MAVDVAKIIRELVVPELHEIKTKVYTIEVEIRRLDGRIDGLNDKIDTGFKRLDGRIDGLNDKIDTGFKRLDGRIDGVKENVRNLREEFRTAIDMHERIATLEAKLAIH